MYLRLGRFFAFCTVLVMIVIVPSLLFAFSVRSGHPRIFLNPGDVASLRDRCLNGEVRDQYNLLKAAVDFYGSEGGPGNAGTINNAIANALVYLVEGNSVYLNRSVNFISANNWTNAVAYDWLYNNMSSDQRSALRSIMEQGADVEIVTSWRPWWNMCWTSQATSFFFNLAIYGDGIDDQWALQQLNNWEVWLENEAIPALNLISGNGVGGDGEGLGYCNEFQSRIIPASLEGWRTATNPREDKWSECLWDDGLISWYLHSLVPHRNGGTNWIGDVHTLPRHPHILSLPLLLARNRDPYGHWWYRNSVEPSYYSEQYKHLYYWSHCLWYDPSVSMLNIQSLPLQKYFSGIGQVTMRSGWDEDDTWALFISGPFYEAHQQNDVNTFVIHRKGDLALDAGYYNVPSPAGPHLYNYRQRTVARNCILVHDPDEVFEAWGGVFSNDGGQIIHRSSEIMGLKGGTNALPVGTIEKYEYTPDYVYVKGRANQDSGEYYRNAYVAKVSSFTREFVYLRPQTFVIFDRISSPQNYVNKPGYFKRWILHMQDEPTIQGTLVGSGGGYAEYQGDIFYFTQADGKMFGKKLLPQDAKIRKRGGTGYEYWVNGTNYEPVSTNHNGGRWRIEVEPTVAQATDLFLHVLYVCDDTATIMPHSIDIGDTDGDGTPDFDLKDLIGTIIDMPDGTTWVVALNGGDDLVEGRIFLPSICLSLSNDVYSFAVDQRGIGFDISYNAYSVMRLRRIPLSARVWENEVEITPLSYASEGAEMICSAEKPTEVEFTLGELKPHEQYMVSDLFGDVVNGLNRTDDEGRLILKLELDGSHRIVVRRIPLGETSEIARASFGE